MSLHKFSLAGIVCVLLLCWPVMGQQLIRGGNALDANPQRGSGGFNPAGRQYDFNAGNRIVSGNVSGGRAFQGYSPIRDSSSLFLGSPNYNSYGTTGSSISRSRSGYTSGYAADSLSNFYRDSYSYGDDRDPYAPAWRSGAYYSSPAYAAGASGYAQGLNRLGSSQAGGLYGPIRPGRLLSATPQDPLVAARQSLQGGSAVAQIPDVYQTRSGGVSADQVVRDAAQDQAATGGAGPRPLTSMVDTRVKVPGPDDPRRIDNLNPTAVPPARAESLEAILERGRNLESRLAKPMQPLGPGREGGTAGSRSQASPEPSEVVPGVTGPESVTPPPAPIQYAERAKAVADLRMGQATKSLKEAKYYQAASQFELAQTVDPRNPTPALGQAMALLGAGDYLSSAAALFRAMRLLEEEQGNRVDALAFARDVSNLNDRIVELRERLQANDDYRFRFLLGYAEYALGLKDLGVGHMDRAIALRTKELNDNRPPAGLETPATTRPADSGQAADPELQCLVRFAERVKSGSPSPEVKPATRPAGR